MEKIRKIAISLMIGIILVSFNIPVEALSYIRIYSSYGNELRQEEGIKQETKELIENDLIPLNQSQIHDECILQKKDTFVRMSDVLVDDQENVPKQSMKEASEEQIAILKKDTWYPATKTDISSVSCYIDLGAIYQITHIAFVDTNGSPTIEFKQGTPFHWNTITTHKMTSYMQWVYLPVENVTSQYLQIVSSEKNAGISEIAIYGRKVKDVEKEKEEEIEKPDFGITIDKAIGANGFIDDRMSEIKAVGHIREYHNYRWVITQQGKNKFNPAAAWPWNFDEYYKMLHDNNIDVIPCIQGTSSFLLNPTDVKNKNVTYNEKPLKYDADPSKPESYTDHASTLFQYAARYGSTKVDNSKLLLGEDQEAKTGLGYIQYYENNNEPDKTWETMKSYSSPYELAAMCSADYDGHEGKMGDTYGIKNADPNSKLVLGGLAGGQTEYLDLMKLWFENNREDKKIAFDVINFHCYSSNKAPEESEFRQKCESITNWRDENAPDKEVWLTEFGWDTNINSPLAAPNEKTQGDWLVRGYLNAFAAGIDRASMYMLRDASYASNPGKYGTSGLVTEKGAWTKKPSWYYVSTLKQVLTDYTLKDVQESKQIYQYTFEKKGTNQLCYVLWCPTSNGSKIDNYLLPIGDKTKATLTTLEDGYYDGIRSKLKIENGSVKVNVSESPIFITVDGKEGAYIEPTNQKIKITPEMITSDNQEALAGQDKLTEQDILKQFQNMLDEQEQLPNGPDARYNGRLTTKWQNLWPYTVFPVEGKIDLKEKYVITAIGMYDSTAIGKIRFYQGDGNNWEKEASLEYGLDTYNSWVVKPVNMETQYLKIEKEDNAECYGIALYGYSIAEADWDPNEELNKPEEPTPPPVEEELKVSFPSYQEKENYVIGITEKTNGKEFKQKIQTNAEKILLQDPKGTEIINGIVSTGSKVILTKGTKQKEYTLIVTGDINQDGQMDITDLLLLKRHILSGTKPEWKIGKIKELAANMNQDNQVDITDLLLFKRRLIGKE